MQPRPYVRTTLRWILRGFIVLVIIETFHVSILAFPGVLFAHQREYDGYSVYSDREFPHDLDLVINDTSRRVAAMESVEDTGFQHVFLCHDPKRYAFFAFLSRRTSESLAFALSMPRHTFVNMPRVERFREANRDVIHHSRFEGNLAEVIAHEIGHFKSLGILGFRRHLSQPRWKSEGFAEYQANVAAIEADPNYDLHARVALLLDDGNWKTPVARRQWESQLLVEYLVRVEGYSLEDLVRPNVTEAAVLTSMLEWHRR